MAVATTILLDVLCANSKSTENDTGAIDRRIQNAISMQSGTSAGQADLCFADRRTLAGTTSEVLDLAGVLTDVFGATLTFVKVKLIVIRNRNIVDGDDLQVGPDSTNGFLPPWADASDRSIVPAGRTTSDPGLFLWYDPAGVAVGAGATDELFINNAGANSIDYDIIVVGTSA